jgi:hypothetical protein
MEKRDPNGFYIDGPPFAPIDDVLDLTADCERLESRRYAIEIRRPLTPQECKKLGVPLGSLLSGAKLTTGNIGWRVYEVDKDAQATEEEEE